MELQTPSILFGSISLILLAYTNRFHTLALLIREIHSSTADVDGKLAKAQIPLLRRRLNLVKYMQACGVLSFLLCTTSLFFLFFEQQDIGQLMFIASVALLMLSLSLSLWEAIVSTQALDLVLTDWESR